MRKIVILAIALLVLASSANAFVWTGTLGSSSPTNPAGWIDVTVNATLTAGLWDWTYDITPVSGAKDISAFSLDVGALAIATPISILPSSNTALGWGDSRTLNSLQWTTSGTVIGAGQTGRFEFTTKWGPSVANWGYAQDHGQYAGLVPTPSLSVPEPMSILLGIMGLGSIAGFRKLRRK